MWLRCGTQCVTKAKYSPSFTLNSAKPLDSRRTSPFAPLSFGHDPSCRSVLSECERPLSSMIKLSNNMLVRACEA